MSIDKPNQHFDVVTYTGNGATNTVTGLNFTPDFVWIKSRSAATDHALYDSVRGTTKDLVSNSTAAETTQSTGLTAFNSNGFTVGSLAKLNTNAATYVAWCWKAGGTAVTNTAGTITSQVSANPTAGFSVVKWNGVTNGTVGHGLGIAPKFIIARAPTVVSSFEVYHASLGTNGALFLNTTGAFSSLSNYWGNVNSNTFLGGTSSGAGNNNSAGTVAYCWSEVPGFSKFGSYTGNGSADGPFVYCGFRPRFVLIKRTDTTGNWQMYDSGRAGFNVIKTTSAADLSNAESSFTSGYDVDFLSNGFKWRAAGVVNNTNGGTYIYAAFAEAPFEYSLGR